MSAFTHSSTCTLHSAVAIGISCTFSLYIRQDSIDMSAFTHSSTCTLHSAVAIGISCTQSLGVDFSPATPRGAGAGIVCIVCRVHARTVREKTRTGLGGRAHVSIQGGNMIISIMSISLRITFKTS